MDFFGISLLLMLPAGFIIVVLIFAYLIYNRIKREKTEKFEKRDN